MENRHITDQQQLLAELAREGFQSRRETSTVVSPGARIPARAVTVKSRIAYNVYRVRAVVIGNPGAAPIEIGEQMEAINLAESFLTEGSLAPGVYAVMSRVGEKNVFHAVP
jgi:hypothetical protein